MASSLNAASVEAPVIAFAPLTLPASGGEGLSLSRTSITSRSGFESCDAVKVTGGVCASRSSTTRVTPGCVSATRICLSSMSPTGTTSMRFWLIAGLAPRMSKNNRSGSDSRSE